MSNAEDTSQAYPDWSMRAMAANFSPQRSDMRAENRDAFTVSDRGGEFDGQLQKVQICTLRNKRSVAVEGLVSVHKHNNEHDFHTANTVSTRKNDGAK